MRKFNYGDHGVVVSVFHFLRVTPWFIFLLISFFISCKSVPKTSDLPFVGGNNILLDSGASVYIFADVKQARPIIDLIPMEELKDRQARQMLDRTDFLAAAFFPPEKERYFQIAAWGNYPKFWAGMAFSLNRNWKKRQTAAKESYWYSQKNGLSISLNSRQAFAASSWFEDAPSIPFAFAPFAQIPDGFNDFRGASPLSLWLENPAPLLSQALRNYGIPLNFPVQKLFINFYPVSSGNHNSLYEASIRMGFENALHARSMAAIFSLAGNFSTEDPLTAIFFANPPVVNGNNIDIKTSVLSENALSLLLEMFLLYLM